MVTLNRIYTRTGDKGSTALASGERRSKADLRIETYGTVDETNACIGLVRLHAEPRLDAMLSAIQNDLFDLGADLATPESAEPPKYEPLRIVAAQVQRVERDIDALNADLSPLKSFVLPGGSPASAALHLARTVCRRAERLAVAGGVGALFARRSRAVAVAAVLVMAVALGEATKTVPHAGDGLKTYRFTVRWGAATTSDDAEGAVIATSEARPTPEAITAAEARVKSTAPTL